MSYSNPSTLVMQKPSPHGTHSNLLSRSSTARLRLDVTLGHRGAVDGAWWPRSRDANAEIPALLVALDAALGRLSRFVSVHVDTWDNIPRRLPVAGRVVRVGWFRSMDARSVSVTMDRGDPVELLVIPAETAETPARLAMTMAASGRDRGRPTDILAAGNAVTRTPTPRWVERDQEQVWENEGGRTGAVPRRS